MPRPLLVALLVVCAFAATPAPAVPSLQPSHAGDGPPDVTADVAVLGLDGPARTNVTSPSLDVATAVATQREVARAELSRHSLDAAFERADGEQPRRELLLEAATEVEISISALRSTQRDLRGRYVAGDVTTETFLRRQAVHEARAEQLHLNLETILTLAEEVPRLSMRSRVRSLDAGLTGFEGPVTTRAVDSVTGEADPTRLYVSSSANGTALSMFSDDEYVRQGFRSDNWVPDSTTGLGLDAIETRAGELYPIAFNSSQTTSRGIQIVGAGIYRIEIGYEQGSIVAYLDGDTRDVFYEVQRQPTELIEPRPAVTTVDNGTRLTVNRTFAGGPLRVAVVDARTGDPVEATVSVDGSTVTTGADGVVWTLMPGEEARVTATTASGRTSATVGAEPFAAVRDTPALAGDPPAVTAEPK